MKDFLPTPLLENTPDLWLKNYSWPRLEGNKYDRGHLLVLGGEEMTGAGCLAAAAGQRIGAGLVTIMCPPGASLFYRQAPASVMMVGYTKTKEILDYISARKVKAVIIGPGALPDKRTRTLVHALCILENCSLALDAGALTAFEHHQKKLFNVLHRRIVLTPHRGEYERLFSTTENKSTAELALAAAKTSGAHVVLKGAGTIIASPEGETILSTNAPPDLATAGSGDVLAGMIGGLLAQGMNPLHASAAAVWMHGEAANLFGPGLIADDLVDMIPRVLKNLKST